MTEQELKSKLKLSNTEFKDDLVTVTFNLDSQEFQYDLGLDRYKEGMDLFEFMFEENKVDMLTKLNNQ